jgi:NAD(P) transhydrogenase
MLMLLVDTHDGRLLGVHAIGTGATEVIHIGQAVMALGVTVDYLVDTVFNYPTLAELQGRGARRVQQDGRARPRQRGRLTRVLSLAGAATRFLSRRSPAEGARPEDGVDAS